MLEMTHIVPYYTVAGLGIEIRFSFILISFFTRIDSDRFFLRCAFVPSRLDNFGVIVVFPVA